MATSRKASSCHVRTVRAESTSLRLAPVQKHSQGPKQAAGVPPLQAICEEWHSIIAEPELHWVFTGPLAMRPRPAIVFLRAFVENSTAASCVKLSPTAETLVQSPACAVTENAQTVTAATKPNLKICICPPVKLKATLTLVDCLAVAKWRTIDSADNGTATMSAIGLTGRQGRHSFQSARMNTPAMTVTVTAAQGPLRTARLAAGLSACRSGSSEENRVVLVMCPRTSS